MVWRVDANVSKEFNESISRVEDLNVEEALSSLNLVPMYKAIGRHNIFMGRNYLYFLHPRAEGFISSVRTLCCNVVFVLYFLLLPRGRFTVLGNLI